MSNQPPATERPNATMSDNWNGVGGEHWVRNAERHDRALAAYGEAVLAAAAVAPGDRVLDIGCGTGALTRAAGRQATAGTALGVDIGRPMVDAALADAAADGLANVTFEQVDAQVHPFPPGSVDVAISRFGVMFFDDPAAAFGNIRRALVGAGRLVFMCWQSLVANDWMLIPANAFAEHVGLPDTGGPHAPGPFSLAEPDRVRAVLDAAGFTDVALDDVAHPMWLGTDVDDAVGYMRNQSIARAMFADQPSALVEQPSHRCGKRSPPMPAPTGCRCPAGPGSSRPGRHDRGRRHPIWRLSRPHGAVTDARSGPQVGQPTMGATSSSGSVTTS